MRSKKIEFTPPTGSVPEGVSSGEDFALVCTFRVKNGGTVCLVEMGDQKMPGYDDSGDSKSQPDYSSEAQAIQGAMGGS